MPTYLIPGGTMNTISSIALAILEKDDKCLSPSRHAWSAVFHSLDHYRRKIILVKVLPTVLFDCLPQSLADLFGTLVALLI